MLKDIKIKLTKEHQPSDLIAHAICLGYDWITQNIPYLVGAEFFILSPDQPIRYCDSDMFDNGFESYEEMTEGEFLNYWGGV